MERFPAWRFRLEASGSSVFPLRAAARQSAVDDRLLAPHIVFAAHWGIIVLVREKYCRSWLMEKWTTLRCAPRCPLFRSLCYYSNHSRPHQGVEQRIPARFDQDRHPRSGQVASPPVLSSFLFRFGDRKPSAVSSIRPLLDANLRCVMQRSQTLLGNKLYRLSKPDG